MDSSGFGGSILMRSVAMTEITQLAEQDAQHPEHSVDVNPKEMTGDARDSSSKEDTTHPFASRLLAVLPNAMCPYLPGDRTRTGYYGLRTPICFYTETGEQVTYDPAFVQPSSSSSSNTPPNPGTAPSPSALKTTIAASKSFVGSLASNDSSVNSSGGRDPSIWPIVTQSQPQFWPNRGGQNGRRTDNDGNGGGRGGGRGRYHQRGGAGRLRRGGASNHNNGGAARQNQQPPQATATQ
ncbi:hypothetical protein RvY_13546 [Ramazzottius varieornatus]|uniref:Uncharacterized protein n=1 Tax=Ramazzottius varieornatus TaxID=947166 RepID=A0A1D1VVQ1_RAMVA|nr:hypothetical protein RvY_13546 [Ramazzottius varieornatus]